jgi:PAS domain S-box-containing protein
VRSVGEQSLELRLREMNEALLISSVRQHELTEKAQKAEAALRESEGRFRLMNEIMPQKIFTADEKGEVTYFNPQWMAFSGLSFEQMKGWGWTQFIHPEDVDESIRAWLESVAAGTPFQFEHRFRRADGTYLWYISRALPMRNDEGQIILWVGSSTNIDDTRRADEAARERLEDQVMLRTAELLEINEQLQGFTYSVAHDLRQQIRGISSNASILMLEALEVLDAESLQTLHRLVGSAKKLGTLVDDLLTYARLGRREPTKESFDLTALTEEVADFLVENGKCGKSTVFKIAKGLVGYGDPLLIRIVIENLLDNACKYSVATKDPVIEVDHTGEAFFVRDNGIGFDMRFHDKLFQPFERLHSESIYPGTGIGLANVRRIVDEHGGKVWAEGNPGAGATLYFVLG